MLYSDSFFFFMCVINFGFWLTWGVIVLLLSCQAVFRSLWSHGLQPHKALLSFTISQSLLRFTSIELLMLFNHLILCRPLLRLHSIFPSIRVFSNELTLCIRRPKYWSFSFRNSPSNEYSGLVSFRIHWFDLAVEGTLKSLLQHHSLKVWYNSLYTWLS